MFPNVFKKFSRDERGATLVEYGVAVIVAVLVGTAGLIGMGTQIDGNMNAAATEMTIPEES